MTKFYIFIQKILRLKQKLAARLGYTCANSAILKIEADQARRAACLIARKRSMEQRLQKRYQARPSLPRQYEKWI
jgi:hypothetical protein